MNEKLGALAKQIWKEYYGTDEQITMEEAFEMARMELGAKTADIVDAGKEKGGNRKPKVVKVSDEKKALFQTILLNLSRCEGVELENIDVLTENKLISVEINGKIFKIDVIECRNKKK